MAKIAWHPKACACNDCNGQDELPPIDAPELVKVDSNLRDYQVEAIQAVQDRALRMRSLISNPKIFIDPKVPGQHVGRALRPLPPMVIPMTEEQGRALVGKHRERHSEIFEFINTDQHQRKAERIRSFLPSGRTLQQPQRLKRLVTANLDGSDRKSYALLPDGRVVKPRLRPVYNLHVAPRWVCYENFPSPPRFWGHTPQEAYSNWVLGVTGN